MAEDFTFQYNNGVILNAEFAPGLPFVDIQKVSGLDHPEFRVTDRSREGGDGGFMDTGFVDMRTVVLEGIIYGDEDYLATLRQNWRPYREGRDGTGGSAPFVFKAPGIADRVLFGRSLGMKYDWGEVRRVGKTEVQFQLRCEDPSFYSFVEHSGQLGLTILTQTGYGYNRAYNRTYGGGTSGGGSGNFLNAGNKETFPNLVIQGPATNPKLTNDTFDTVSTAYLKFNATLSSTDTLTISTKNRTVILNGTANRRLWLDPLSRWWSLLPGSNYVRFTADAYDASALLTVTWRDAYE